MPIVHTHCPYCALQCGLKLSGSRDRPEVTEDPNFPVNRGGLCIKGWTAAATLGHPERLLRPLVRNVGGELIETTWGRALARVGTAIREIQYRHGRDAVAVFGGGSLTNEKAYLLGKFARVALGTSNIDYNGRFCMSSAAAAMTQAFGLDRGLPFPLEDIPRAQAILLVGGNVAETMPPIMQYFEAQQANQGRLIIVDPRRTSTARWAALHLQLRPGSDTALANGLLHILIRDGLIDPEYIRTRTEGFEELRNVVAGYWPERVESLTGIPEAQLVEAARMLGTARTAMILTARGPEQQAQGVNNTLAFINIALALGKVGKPASGFGSLTGQGNGQGGREHGQKADQLPGYRRIDDPSARLHVGKVWGVSQHKIPWPGRSAFELLDSLGSDIRALFVMGSNVAVSAPDSLRIHARLRSLNLLVVADFFLSETAELAHVVLPTAQWAEEDGTMTNLEGRVIRRRRAFEPPEGVRTDLDVLCALAAELGKGRFFRFANSRDVFDELRQASCGGPADYSGVTYDRIDAEAGVFWPCRDESDPGSPRIFADGFPTPSGRARFYPVRHQSPAETPEAGYPLHLTTGRVLAQYQSGTQTRRVAQLNAMVPEAVAELHPATAERLGLSDSDTVQLTTRRGTAVFKLRLTRTIREDTVFVPFHWSGAAGANRLTNTALDPVSRMPEFKVCAVRVEKVAERPPPLVGRPHAATSFGEPRRSAKREGGGPASKDVS